MNCYVETLLIKIYNFTMNITYKSRETTQITFIIGNGFDLNLKMPTSFSDFYNWLRATYSVLDPDSITNLLIKDICSEKPIINWSDLESGLGDATESYKDIENGEGQFFSDLKELINYLVKYLKDVDKEFEENLSRLSKDELEKKVQVFETDILNCGRYFSKWKELSGNPVLEEDYISSLIRNSSNLTINFITLNYTSALDHYQQKLKNKSIYNGRCYIDFKTPIHVHGTLEHGIILGIEDSSQAKYPELISSPLLQRTFEKSVARQTNGTNIEDQVGKIIFNSDAIILYGCSLGKIDKNLIHAIVQAVKNDPNRILGIFGYDHSIQKDPQILSTYIDRGNLEENLKSRLGKLGNHPNLSKDFSDRVLLAYNSNIFSGLL